MTPRAWSFSSLTKFENCPKEYYHVDVRKQFAEEKGEATSTGEDIHLAIENYIKKGQPFPLHTKYVAKKVDAILEAVDRRAPGAKRFSESKLALTRSLEPCAFFARDVWVRSIVDYGVHTEKGAVIVDWKTGKKRPNMDQLALMAMVVMATDPSIDRVAAMFVWLTEPRDTMVTSKVYERDRDYDEHWAEFRRRAAVFEQAFVDDTWPARPGWKCGRFCPVKTCEHNR